MVKRRQNIVYAIEQAILCAVMCGGFVAVLKIFSLLLGSVG